MADNTTIEWSDTTWNPMLGCTRVSAGCDRCYAITQATIRAGNPHPKVSAAFAGLTERRDGRMDWTGQINLLPKRLAHPLTWRKPRRVFVNSLSDLFADEVPASYIARIFAVMARTPQHTYQILTKRHARMRSLISGLDGSGHPLLEAADDEDTARALYDAPWPLPNVWLGVSVEDQKWANIRIPALLETPAAVRWLSCEPLLGPIDLTEVAIGVRYANRGFNALAGDPAIQWVVVGGESGPGARPMSPVWARSLRDQCVAAQVPYFFKQWGEWAPNGWRGIGNTNSRERLVGPVLDDLGHREVIERVGKKRAGRLLDDRTWDEYPAAQAVAA